MKTPPDKIYVQINDRGFATGANCKFKQDDIEFINKNTLVEWLKEMESLAGVLKKEAYKSVIDKLNSL